MAAPGDVVFSAIACYSGSMAKMMKVRQYAKHVGADQRTVRRWIRDGLLEFIPPPEAHPHDARLIDSSQPRPKPRRKGRTVKLTDRDRQADAARRQAKADAARRQAKAKAKADADAMRDAEADDEWDADDEARWQAETDAEADAKADAKARREAKAKADAKADAEWV